MSDKQEFHFFTSSALHWNTHEDLLKVLMRQKKMDTAKSQMYQATFCNVFKVPLPADAKYSIENYEPEVEGTEFIATVKY
jgi:hypothetical protein